MPSTRYERGNLVTMASTDLDGLGANAGVFCTTHYDNGHMDNLYLWGDMELTVSFGTAPTAGRVVELYVIPADDGSNYATANPTSPPANLIAGAWVVRNVTTAQRLVLRQVPLPPSRFRLLIRNTTDQAFAGTGNEVQMLPYRLQI